MHRGTTNDTSFSVAIAPLFFNDRRVRERECFDDYCWPNNGVPKGARGGGNAFQNRCHFAHRCKLRSSLHRHAFSPWMKGEFSWIEK